MALSEDAVPLREPSPYVVLARPVAAVAVGVLSVAAVARFGASDQLPVAVFVIAVLGALSVIDVEQQRLPNVIVLPSAAAVLIAQIALFPGQALEWIGAAVGAGLIFLVLALLSRTGLGMGDVKLALLLGAALGGSVVAALFVGTLAAAGYSLALLARHGSEARKQTFPLGPFLAFGAVVVLLAPESLGL
jgi:leader peptidase (prepilin peptidase)/N-methyltransferase